MKTRITQTLRRLERDRNIKVLYACETGSRAWGFPSPDSDYDVRLIYMHHPDWYLSLSEQKDTLEYMSDDGELDLTGWDIRKALRLLMKSNGALLERIQSPIVYAESGEFAREMRQVADRFYSPIATMHHYLGMAKKSFAEVEGAEMVRLKRLFYALRAATACKWIATQDGPPPIVFPEMLGRLPIAPALQERIAVLIDLKAGKSESYMHPQEKDLNGYIRAEIEAAEKVAAALPSGKGKREELDSFFRKVLKAHWP